MTVKLQRISCIGSCKWVPELLGRPKLHFKDVCDILEIDIPADNWESLSGDWSKWRTACRQLLETGEIKLNADLMQQGRKGRWQPEQFHQLRIPVKSVLLLKDWTYQSQEKVHASLLSHRHCLASTYYYYLLLPTTTIIIIIIIITNTHKGKIRYLLWIIYYL